MNECTVVTPAGEAAYVEVGEGPAALFVHGVFVNSGLWRHVMPALADRRRCVAVDLPAHGRTPAPAAPDYRLGAMADWLAGFCDALGLTTVDLVGNDTGGALCQVFAARHPERIRSLVLTNCDTQDTFPPEAFAGAVELARQGQLVPVLRAVLDNLEIARTPAGFGAVFERPESITEETVQRYLGPLFEDESRVRVVEGYVANMDADDLRAAEAGLRALGVPALLVWGTGDVFFDVKWAYWLRDLLPGAETVVEVDGGALFFPDERPAELIEPLRRFWS
ncbi:MAG: alpha/beta hydrolase [Actinobacteria bacterium]|nr:alpha/beta hydrolase [Actinomycetota bacterium]